MSVTGLVCGVDEAGRGPLAGSVFAAAVVLSDSIAIRGLDDSKRLSPRRRTELADEIRRHARAWAIAHATVEEIERLNILQASLLAMHRAVIAIHHGQNQPLALALVDGNRLPLALPCEGRAIVGGDASVPAISAASILAKTERDLDMDRLARQWPGYGFEQHKGYGTPAHLEALRRLGPCSAHRRSFAPVRQLLEAM